MRFFPLTRCLLLMLPLIALGQRAPLDPTRFENPLLEDRPMVWWHWMNGSISREGIRAELEDMKRAGLAGAQMLDIAPGFTPETMFPPGPVRWGSEQWHADWQYAIRTAGELGLKLGMMNCAGWSESGGPWVTPDESMKKVVWSETPVAGSATDSIVLPVPAHHFGFYRDIAVLAVPADPAPDAALPAVACSIPGLDVSRLVDGRFGPDDGVTFPRGTTSPRVTYTYAEPVERRLLTLGAPFKRGTDVKLSGDVEVSDDGVQFRRIRSFAFSGWLFAHKGYLGSDLVLTIPFAPVRAKHFRVSFKGPVNPLVLTELALGSAYRVENFQTKTLTSNLGGILPPADAPASDPAAIAPAAIMELTSSLRSDGTLDWKAPPGRWTVLRFGYTTTGLPNHPAQDEGTGLEVDKMSRAALRRHLGFALGRILREAGPLKGTVLNSLLSDSWEAAQQNWTQDFAAEFRARRGYGLVAYLPALTGRVVSSLADTEGFLADFRHTCSDLIAENYFAELRRFAEENGMHYYGESYGGRTYDPFRAAANVDVNMAEFWFRKDRSTLSTSGVKTVAAVAHALGRSLVAAESFTATQVDAGWSASPYLLKPVGDLAFSSGVTQMFLHSYVHQPYPNLQPGFTVGSSGTNFGRLNTWWPRARAWVDYLARCQYLLRQGTAVSDILLVRNTEIDGFSAGTYPPIPDGYDFDHADAVLLGRAKCEGGRVRLPGGAEYRVVVLPATWMADLPLLETIQALAAGGAEIVAPPPHAAAGRLDPASRSRWEELVRTLWPAGGTPRIHRHADLDKVLAALGVGPDCRFEGSGAPVHWLHRRTADADVYFVSSASERPTMLGCDFRTSGRRPELWDPVTGRTVMVPAFASAGGRTRLSIGLADAGSTFVVFRAPDNRAHPVAVTSTDGTAVAVGDGLAAGSDGRIYADRPGSLRVAMSDGSVRDLATAAPALIASATPWTVEFIAPDGKRFTREFATLRSWTAGNDELKYFSGMAVYRTTVEIPSASLRPGQLCLLDLGEVRDVATVTLNHEPVGTVWTPPYRVDVTRVIKPGANTVEIEIRNRWVNRLMGDDKLPMDVQYQQKLPNGRSWGIIQKFPDWLNDPSQIERRSRRTFVTYMTKYKPEDTPPTSGLLGPVRVRFLSEVKTE